MFEQTDSRGSLQFMSLLIVIYTAVFCAIGELLPSGGYSTMCALISGLIVYGVLFTIASLLFLTDPKGNSGGAIMAQGAMLFFLAPTVPLLDSFLVLQAANLILALSIGTDQFLWRWLPNNPPALKADPVRDLGGSAYRQSARPPDYDGSTWRARLHVRLYCKYAP